MESIYHIKNHDYFNVPDEDFDKFQNIFAMFDTYSEEDAVSDVECSEDTFTRTYTEDEIKSIFWEHAELTGIDKQIKKDKVVDYSTRRKATDELKEFIKSKGKKKLSLKSAETLMKVVEAFDSYECEIE